MSEEIHHHHHHHHHHQHEVDDATKFKYDSLKHIKIKKAIAKWLFRALCVVAVIMVILVIVVAILS